MTKSLRPCIVGRYPTPAYPDRQMALREPALLAASLPPAWRTRGELAGAVGVCLAASSLGAEPPTASPSPTKALPVAAVVAPLFKHGAGRGVTGCVAVAPPAFLSEEEALVVIREVLSENGIAALEKDVPLEGVTLTVGKRKTVIERNWVTEEVIGHLAVVPTPVPLEADLRDASRAVVVEYVSVEDEAAWRDDSNNWSSVTQHDLVATAERVRAAVSDQAQGLYLATFYDPFVLVRYNLADVINSNGASFEELERLAEQEARELLRQQVLDFVKWLEAQGAM